MLTANIGPISDMRLRKRVTAKQSLWVATQRECAKAIKYGRLSGVKGEKNWVGDYMYMGKDKDGEAVFVHRVSGERLEWG